MIDRFEEILQGYMEEVLEARREIHENPELAYEEFETAKTIKKILDKYGIEYMDNLCKTGIAALIRGGNPGKTVAIRCDMDALPIQEKTGVEFASKKKDIMHACGHDSHVAMALGTALVINQFKDELKGNVKIIFQPAEEHGIVGGAKIMIEEGVLENPSVDCIFGMHVWPEMGGGKFGVADGEMMASCDIWKLRLIGEGGHISAPHKAKNPIFVAAQLINTIAGIRTQSIDPFENVVFDIGSMHAGTVVGNIIPEEVSFVGNTRVYNNELREKIKEEFVDVLEGFSKAYKIEYELDYQFGYAPVVNSSEPAKVFKAGASKILGAENMFIPQAVMGSEDFGEYLKYVPGAFGWLGVKQEEYIGLHNARFIVDEDTIKNGILIYCRTIWDYLNF